MHASYTPDMTMRAARDLYFEVNGFGADGGYADPWVDFKLGPLPLPFPNTAGRVAALKFHDLHHVLTGYETNATGEFEISAWEVGAGCGRFPAAWVINHSGLASGLIAAPRKIFAAYVRGRRSRSLYGEAFEPLLEQRVGEMRERYIVNESRATVRDAAVFAYTALSGIVIGLAFAAVVLPLVPIGLVATWLRRRQALRTA